MNQIYFSRKLYQPRKTDVPLNTLLFYLKWFSDNKIECAIEDIHDLTTLTISGTHRVKLLYSYMVSISDVVNTVFDSVDSVVNTHNWNRGPWSDDAMEYAESIGLRVFTQGQFFSYCHREHK